jgi:prephenate dehydrogenase
MDVLVVGAGAMGEWFARTVGADVAFADVDRTAAQAAASSVGGRAVPLDGDETFDAVCVAVPISEVAEAIAGQAHRARSALLDVTGAMEPAVEAMRAAAPERERVSTHPLFAPENAPGNVAVVRDREGPTSDALLADLADADNELFETTPAEHDSAMETVQAAAHAAVLSYALAAREVRPEFHTPVSGDLADLVGTVTGGNPAVYREIQATFDGAERVAEAASRLATADLESGAFEALYREAGSGTLGEEPDGVGDRDTGCADPGTGAVDPEPGDDREFAPDGRPGGDGQ